MIFFFFYISRYEINGILYNTDFRSTCIHIVNRYYKCLNYTCTYTGNIPITNFNKIYRYSFVYFVMHNEATETHAPYPVCVLHAANGPWKSGAMTILFRPRI